MKKLKENKGFTLVELIVVIAILGILASVAVPAYSGYISKANKAKDDAQIEVMNTALSGAAAIHGKNMSDLAVTLSGTAVSTVTYDADQSIKYDYDALYNGNSGWTLSYYTKLEWDGTDHVVKGSSSGN